MFSAATICSDDFDIFFLSLLIVAKLDMSVSACLSNPYPRMALLDAESSFTRGQEVTIMGQGRHAILDKPATTLSSVYSLDSVSASSPLAHMAPPSIAMASPLTCEPARLAR
jgi:hypothetical protein